MNDVYTEEEKKVIARFIRNELILGWGMTDDIKHQWSRGQAVKEHNAWMQDLLSIIDPQTTEQSNPEQEERHGTI